MSQKLNSSIYQLNNLPDNYPLFNDTQVSPSSTPNILEPPLLICRSDVEPGIGRSIQPTHTHPADRYPTSSKQASRLTPGTVIRPPRPHPRAPGRPYQASRYPTSPRQGFYHVSVAC
ncbi:hypothetical protein E2C01_043829 [Portunus trituberculatus]|uniref:Uncharacterized protein n=1 Tax=Portunus trituberculatus TaxID=210409 RepID=A0A5B7FQG8_PORTR|nr:hypothetical protein [Portunus trituberculatus]